MVQPLHTESFKIPRYTMTMDEFPITPSGKVQKFMLRDMVAGFSTKSMRAAAPAN